MGEIIFYLQGDHKCMVNVGRGGWTSFEVSREMQPTQKLVSTTWGVQGNLVSILIAGHIVAPFIPCCMT